MPAWLTASRPVAKGLAAVIAPAATIITTLLALGIITPFGGGDALAQGARETVEAGTSRMALSVVSQGKGDVTRYTADGAFDYRSGRGELRYDFSATPGLEAATAVDVRFADDLVYIRFPPASGVPAARPWVRADLDATDKLLADAAAAGALPDDAPDLGILADIGVSDPSRVLEDLQRSGEVDDLGEERIFGVATHKYRGKLGAGKRGRDERATATAWIGDDHLIRRLVLAGDGSGEKVQTTMDFTGFGTPVSVDPPPADKVTDLVRLLSNLIARG